jgi:hypothetical protein
VSMRVVVRIVGRKVGRKIYDTPDSRAMERGFCYYMAWVKFRGQPDGGTH